MKFILVFLTFLVNFAVAAEPNEIVFVFHGASDASAGAAIGGDTFIVADDENNTLRVYKVGLAKPIFSFDLSEFLQTTAKNPEADIEGAAKTGNRIYLITSHGRNKDGEYRPNRYRFFAAEIVTDGNSVGIKPVGRPYENLAIDLVSTKSDVQRDLVKATGFGLKLKGKDLERLAPKSEGLNIEGLCASADANTLYIGFRNPQHNKDNKEYAVIVPLQNAASVVEKGRKPAFGKPLLWDLNGLGVRDMVYSPFHKAYFFIAGPGDEKLSFAFYRWSGDKTQQPVLVQKLLLPEKFTPEALIVFEDKERIFVLSDDGNIEVEVRSAADCMEGELIGGRKCPNKFLTDPNKKTFRGMWLGN